MQRKRKVKQRKLKKGVKNFLVFVCAIVIGLFIYKFIRVEDNLFSNVLSISGPDKVYLALTQTKKPSYQAQVKDGEEANLYYTSNNESIVKVDSQGFFTGNSLGETSVVISSNNGVNKVVNVVVTDLIIKPDAITNENKKELQCGIYEESEEDLLEEILFTKIKDAGEGTRAGVVEAARFLTLEFPYKINYFYENGRLQGTDPERAYIDGEGRYYHKGLYLTERKFASLVDGAKTAEPKTWGCDLYSYSTKSYSRNGLNCSGFVSWAMLNGGYDVGDIGAGITEQPDFADLGERVKIDADLLNSGKVKVGDLIGRNGHIAIIIGLEDDTIYVAESYIPSLKLRKFTKQELIDSEDFNYIMLMDSVYKNDGNLTNMW